MTLPAYRDLPQAPNGGRTAWNAYDGDPRGAFSLLTPERITDALACATRGKVFALNHPVDLFDPPLFGRTPVDITFSTVRDGRGVNEVYDGFNPQCSSQWDALGHVAYDKDQFFGGATLQEVLSGERDTMAHWAESGIVARGVLLDLQRNAESRGRPFEPGTSHAFTVEDLEAARAAAGIDFRTGDVLVLHTGFTHWYSELSGAERTRISTREGLTACGVEHTEEMAEYLWNGHFSAVAADCPSFEVWPMDYSDAAAPFGSLHQFLLGQFGMAIGELWRTDALAQDCAGDGVHTFLLTSAPTNSRVSVGSTSNALAIK